MIPRWWAFTWRSNSGKIALLTVPAIAAFALIRYGRMPLLPFVVIVGVLLLASVVRFWRAKGARAQTLSDAQSIQHATVPALSLTQSDVDRPLLGITLSVTGELDSYVFVSY